MNNAYSGKVTLVQAEDASTQLGYIASTQLGYILLNSSLFIMCQACMFADPGLAEQR